jgi:type VI secretion system protein ImpG
LNARAAGDPQVELLMQSFAFLTGRLRNQIEQDKAELPNALLAFLYPHLEAPVPSMLVAEIRPRPDGAREQVLSRGRFVTAAAFNHAGRKVSCRFRTCYSTPLLPLRVTELSLEAGNTALRVRVRAEPGELLHAKGLGPPRLRFYLDNAERGAMRLYEALALHLDGMRVSTCDPSGSPLRSTLLAPHQLRWLGERDEEAVLPSNPHTHPGLRLLQEYFAFSEKFLFFEVSGIGAHDFNGGGDFLDLLFTFSAPLENMPPLSDKLLRLNCVPLVNLFPQRIDPIILDHTRYEYHMMGDLENHRQCEIYAIESLESVTTDGTRPIAPYFAMNDFRDLEHQDYFYVARRQQSQDQHVAGSEMYLSFLDQQFDLCQLRDQVVGGRALCTNRRLPEQLVSASPLLLEGAGPVASMRVLSKPTPHQTAQHIGERPWKLVSQLALNHLSLADDPAALVALKDILRLHLGANAATGHRQIDAIGRMQCRTIVRHLRQDDGWRGFVRGTGVTLEMRREKFKDGASSPVLFCSILRHFLCLYATVNNLVEVTLETNDIKGASTSWSPLAGAKPVL